jgi:hypothetical protein
VNKPLPVPLVTTAIPPDQGILGQATTSVLFGGGNLSDETHPGGRLTAGYWIECQRLGVEGSVFFLNQRAANFHLDSGGVPVIARPYFNVTSGLQDRELIAFPGQFAGGIDVGYSTLLWGAEGNLVYNPFKSCGQYPEFLVGFRYVDLEEHLTITEHFTVLPNGTASFNGVRVPVGSQLSETDSFQTRNEFYGVNLGLRTQYELCCCMYLEFIGKVGLGTTHEIVSINGNTMFLTAPGGPRTLPGGLLALTSNIGRFTDNHFTALPEATANFGVYLCPHIKLWAGYNILYWPDVARPGEQIDPRVNATIHPTDPRFVGRPIGPAVPAVLLGKTDLVVQAINFGLGIEF